MPTNKKLLQAAAGSAGGDNLFPEDVFTTYLYTGNGSSPTITTGIDMLGEGGLVWNKNRTQAIANLLVDSERGSVGKYLSSDSQAAQANITGNSFTNTGYVLGTDMGSINNNNYASWSWRKAKGWFDIVTYTGNGLDNLVVPHNLGSVPKMIFFKRTDGGSTGWLVYNASEGNSKYGVLSHNQAFQAGGAVYFRSTPTSSSFEVGEGYNDGWINGNGMSYVAYVFGDDAVFGTDADESICKMGSYTGDGGAGTTEVNLGFEPQWILVKASSAADNWFIIDNMRGWVTDNNASNDAYLLPNESNAESTGGFLDITATGFKTTLYSNVNVNGRTYIYMAIRRPMKVPEAATEVFDPNAYTATSNSEAVTTGFPVDLFLGLARNVTYYKNVVFDRLRTGTVGLNTASTDDDENYAQYAASLDNNTGFTDNNLTSGNQIISYAFQRASKFFDMVAYNGSGSAPQNVTHNLTVTPEMMIIKYRDGSTNWYVYHSALGNTKACYLETNATPTTSAVFWNNTSPTATQFTLGSFAVNSGKYIAYLFATLAGISKVGSVVHSGTTNVDCGFSAGARFVLVKRTDASGDWYVWDSARGIVAGNDPYLLLNSTAVEVTNTDYIDPLASGFTLTSSFTAGTYVFLAIA